MFSPVDVWLNYTSIKWYAHSISKQGISLEQNSRLPFFPFCFQDFEPLGPQTPPKLRLYLSLTEV